jgi:hypothetical protein
VIGSSVALVAHDGQARCGGFQQDARSWALHGFGVAPRLLVAGLAVQAPDDRPHRFSTTGESRCCLCEKITPEGRPVWRQRGHR